MKLRIIPLFIAIVAVRAFRAVSMAHAGLASGYVVLPPVDPTTPPAIIAIADGLHIADNGSVLTLRDVKNGVWALGSSTVVYKEYYLSVDGLLGYIPDTLGNNAFYGINGRFWAGQFLYERVPQVKQLADATGLTARILQYGTLGYWGTRDFQYGLWRHGWDAGVSIKF